MGDLLPSWGVGRSITCLFIVARTTVLVLVLGWDVVELRFTSNGFTSNGGPDLPEGFV